MRRKLIAVSMITAIAVLLRQQVKQATTEDEELEQRFEYILRYIRFLSGLRHERPLDRIETAQLYRLHDELQILQPRLRRKLQQRSYDFLCLSSRAYNESPERYIDRAINTAHP